MIFDFLKYCLLGFSYMPLLLVAFLFFLLVPGKYRQYWCGYAPMGYDTYGFAKWGFHWNARRGVIWRLAMLSTNMGIPEANPNFDLQLWSQCREAWLQKMGFTEECKWIKVISDGGGKALIGGMR